MDDEWLTVEKAAEALGLSPSTLRHQIARGHLRATKMGRRMHIISRAEVERYRVENKRDPNREPSPSAQYQRERRARQKAQWQHQNLVEPTQQAGGDTPGDGEPASDVLSPEQLRVTTELRSRRRS